VAIVGDYSTSIDLGGQTLTALTADNFIAMFAPGISEPVISSVADIKNDQGRTVKITFAASGEDDPRAYYYGTQYEAYRRTDQAPSQVAGAAAPASRRQLLDSGWTQVGSVSAHGKKTYSIDVPTIGDSTLALGQYFSVFKIRAATTSPYEFHDSPPDSGYSVDNLAPSIPSNLVYAAGSLSWNTSSAKDFDYFTVYGSNTNSFGAAVVINHTVTPGLSVNTSTYPYYFVTATDFSGNEGKPASLKNASGVGDTPTSYVLSVTNYPNPFNPRTTVKYTVPEHARVSVRVFDASGALVTTLFEGESAAGAYSVEWDGRDARGVAISSGVYFARIEQGTESRTKKMVMLK
jgi:hypothetical protein